MYLQPSSSSSKSSVQSDVHRVKIHILQAKLDPAIIAELYELIDNIRGSATLHLELCSTAPDADVIVSNIHMRKRLERHIKWDIARQKAIVTPDWLRDSIEQQRLLPCKDYAALKDLQDETAEHCPDCDQPSCTANTLASERLLSNYAARYACLRASPLLCPNQALVAELGLLQSHRELEGKSVNALGYERAIATIKAYPYLITPDNLEAEVYQLPYLGDKIVSKIREFLKTGAIEECENLRASERFVSLKLFTTVHGVGGTTARTLYSIGLRTMEDMERYYDVMAEDKGTPNGVRRDGLPDLSIQAALALRHELQAHITREEVERMHDVVMAELESIRPGCLSTIVGGYRRGKANSNDVDIVISHPNLRSGGDQVKSLCKLLIQKLYNLRIVTHVTHLSGFHGHNPLRTSNWDTLEKAMTIFKLPAQGQQKNSHRRLDLIFAAPESYWTAIVGWTGSKMFERDLRLWAKIKRGMKFDSSAITRRHDSKRYYPKSEKEVFELLGLEWIDPTLRNADL